MKRILKAIALVSLISQTLACQASEKFVYLVRDSASTNLLMTWCGNPLPPEQFRQQLERIGRISHMYSHNIPVRFDPGITFGELFSVVDTVYAAGVTNISLQMVSNPVPREEAVKNKTTILIEDCSREPPIIIPSFIYRTTLGTGVRKPSIPMGLVNEKTEQDSETDIPVDTGGL
jgi:hypothetical protein